MRQLVEAILKETIKPSSPTSVNKQTFQPSVIDQLLPTSPMYSKSMIFYASAQIKNYRNFYQTLKESLSETLTVFYPFAGRLNEDRTIDCNDHGVPFITAFVDCKLVDLLANPNPRTELLHQFLPMLPSFCPDKSDRPVLAVFQLNKFTCGGIAISSCFNHMLADAITTSTFLKCWSEIAAKVKGVNDYNIIIPQVLLYPQGSEKLPNNLSVSSWNLEKRDGRAVEKRFVFEDWALLKLKENARSEHVNNPSRTEALMSFIWKNLMEASEVVWGCKQQSMLSQPVGLRHIMQLGITPGTLLVGNVIWNTTAHYRSTKAVKNDDNFVISTDGVVEKDLVWQIRQSVNKIRDDFTAKLFNNGAYNTILESFKELKETKHDGDINAYRSSSVTKAGLMDLNFGWGKPTWFCFIGGPADSQKNFILLTDGTLNTVEAWITLDTREMQVLENNPEFLAFASPNPPIFVDDSAKPMSAL